MGRRPANATLGEDEPQSSRVLGGAQLPIVSRAGNAQCGRVQRRAVSSPEPERGVPSNAAPLTLCPPQSCTSGEGFRLAKSADPSGKTGSAQSLDETCKRSFQPFCKFLI